MENYIEIGGLRMPDVSNEYKRIRNYIDQLRIDNHDFRKILSNLESQGVVVVIGGAIRDIILKNKKPKDIDMIVFGNIPDEYFINYAFKNSLGGYKIRLEDLIIDAWSYKDHWAFKNGVVSPMKKFMLRDTSFINMDGAWVSTVDDGWDISPLYVDEIDIAIPDAFEDENPYPQKNIIKAMRLSEEYQKPLSNRMKAYIERHSKVD